LIDHKKLRVRPKGDQEFSHSLVAKRTIKDGKLRSYYIKGTVNSYLETWHIAP